MRYDKPNILLDDERFLLIDHEQCLHFADGQEGHYKMILSDFSNSKINYPYQQHLFYNELKNMKKSQKQYVFDEFYEYLNRFNALEFRRIAIELDDLNVSVGDYIRLYDYLCYLKNNASLVLKGLLTSIS